jgi:hypothetical protein
LIRVAVEVRKGVTSLRETVSADSVSQAVSSVRERYPGRDVRVVFPIDSEEFFVGGPKETRVNEGSQYVLERRAGG